MDNVAEVLPPGVDEDGEVHQVTDLSLLQDSKLVSEMMRAEISQQVATARQYPRSVKRARDNIISLSTLDEEAAQEAIYALPRGKKPIRGPSIRLAEIVQQQWGNNRCAARIIQVDKENKVVIAEGVFHDLETNAAVKATVQRRIVDSKGRLYNDDMIIMTGNAACSIARRNAIFAGIPKAVWRSAYEACEKVIKGDIKTLSERRDRAIKAFAQYGVTPQQLFAVLGVAGEEEVTLEHLPDLYGMYQAIKNGEETVESLFSPRATAAGKVYDKVENPLDDTPPAEQPAQEKRAQQETPAPEQGAEQQTAANGPSQEGGDEAKGSAAEAGGDAAPPATDDPMAIAYQRGREAASKGMTARALPGEYRDEGRAEEAGAWRTGFDEAKAELQAAE